MSRDRDPDAMSMPSPVPSRYDGSKAEPPYPANEAVCPFCGEPDFDLIGLKRHLFLWCPIFDQTDLREAP